MEREIYIRYYLNMFLNLISYILGNINYGFFFFFYLLI